MKLIALVAILYRDQGVQTEDLKIPEHHQKMGFLEVFLEFPKATKR